MHVRTFVSMLWWLCCMRVLCLLQHAALSEYRPIVAGRRQTSFFSMADMKLTLIPVVFIVLRVWSTVRFVLLLADSPARQNPVLVTLHVSQHQIEPKPINYSVKRVWLLLQGIGNSSQGAANCVLFVLLTGPVRARLCAALCCRRQRRADPQRSAEAEEASALGAPGGPGPARPAR